MQRLIRLMSRSAHVISGGLLALVLSTTPITAGATDHAPREQATEAAGVSLPSPSESSTLKERVERFDRSKWYFYVSSGIGRPQYDAQIGSRIREQQSQGGSSHQAGFADLPGIYRRISNEWAIGAVLNASFEHVSGNWRANDQYAIHTYNPAASAFWFRSGKFGVGPFARADLGYSRILQIRQYVHPELGGRFDRLNEDALFTQAALGWGFRATEVARLLFHVNWARSIGRTHEVQGVNFNVGFLF